jgi:MFS transporter, FHS family, glucose/mannose:H+ symporter
MRNPARAHLALLFVGMITFVMMGAGQSIYGPALPAFQRNLTLTEGQAGLLISAHWIGCAFGVAAMYLRGSAIGPQHCLALMALGAAVVMTGAGYIITMLGALIFGAGYGIATVVFNPRILRAFGARGPAMLSLVNATFAGGAIAAPLIFVALGSQPVISFGGVAALAAATWIASLFLPRDLNPPQRATGRFNPRFGLMGFAAIGIGIEAALIGLGPTALIATGVAENTSGRLLSAFFVAFLASRVALVFMAHLVAPFTLYLIAITGTAALAFAAAVWDAPIFFVAMGGCAGLFFPGFYVAAARVMGDDPRVTPTIVAAGLVGGITSPVLLGSVMGWLGDHGFFWLIAVIATATAFAAYVWGRAAMRA